MKNPFDVDKKIEVAINNVGKKTKLVYFVYGVAILSAIISVYFTSSAMSQSAPIAIAVIMAVAISAYIDLTPQIASFLLVKNKHKIVAILLYCSIAIPIVYSMGTTVQTMYNIQGNAIEKNRTKTINTSKKKEAIENAKKERSVLIELREKYIKEVQDAQLGTYKERIARDRVKEIDEKIGSFDKIINEQEEYVRNDFYTFVSNVLGIDGEKIELLFLVIPAVFVDLIAPILLSVVVLL